MAMVQYGLWSNCSNKCDFCLLRERDYISEQKQIDRLEFTIKNLDYVDWENKFSHGISLLGGELYYCPSINVQTKFLELIDKIIEKILKVSPNPYCRYSTVTNGIYDPEFLFKVVDRFVDNGVFDKVDINFSYDLKYRFHSEESRLLCLENLKKYNERYNTKVNVQMIVTQYLIDEYNNKKIEFNDFQEKTLNGNNLNFLYPHAVRTGKVLSDFFFKRKDFIRFLCDLQINYPIMFDNFIFSIYNSSKFKYSGYYHRLSDDVTQQPELEADKVNMSSNCGHSMLYQCYSDCDKCMLCDIIELGFLSNFA